MCVAREVIRHGDASAVYRSASADSACDDSQPRYRRHPSSSDCQLYVACVTGPDGRYVPVVMRCLLGLQWDDNAKMCVPASTTCRHVTHDDHHVTRPDHQLRHFRHDDVVY